MKQCKKCKQTKPLAEFNNLSSSKDGKQPKCKLCCNLYYKQNKERIAIKEKEYRTNNAFKISNTKKAYRERTKEQQKEYFQNYYKENKERIKQYYENNKNKISVTKRNYERKQEKENIQMKTAKRLRTRFYIAVRNRQKAGSAIRDLGCSVPEFLKYIEKLFEPGMSHENYGSWHYDHIRPLCSFDLTNRDQVLQAVHYTNIKPTWAKDNLGKSGKDRKLSIKKKNPAF